MVVWGGMTVVDETVDWDRICPPLHVHTTEGLKIRMKVGENSRENADTLNGEQKTKQKKRGKTNISQDNERPTDK